MIDGLVMTFVDTSRIRLLQLSEQRLAKVLQHLPIRVLGLDAQGGFSWAHGHVFGREPTALLGRDFREAMSTERTQLVELMADAVARGTPRREQVVGMQAGREVIYDVYVEPHRSEQDAHVGVTCIAIQRDGSTSLRN